MFPPRPNEQTVEYPWYERVMPSSLRLRLILPFVALIALVLLVLALVLGERARTVYTERLVEELGAQSYLIADAVTEGDGTSSGLADVVQQLDLDERRMTLIDEDGTVLADSAVTDPTTLDNHNSREEVREARASDVGSGQRLSATVGVEFLYVAVLLDDGSGRVLRTAVPLADIDQVAQRVQEYLLTAALISLALAIGLALFIGYRLAQPLESLRVHAQRVARGDLSGEVEPSATQEIDEVGHAFNVMTHELRTTLDDLDRTRTRLEAVLAGLDDAVVLTTIEGEVLRINAAAERLFGASQERAVGRPFIQIVRDHELDAQLRTALRGERAPRVVTEHGLDRRVLQSTATTVAGKAERLGLMVLRDITELRRLEGVRRDFVANVSHELRTPLTSIRALVETLEAGAIEDPNMTNEFLGRIIGEVDRLNALVEDLMDLARLEAGRSPLHRDDHEPVELLRTAGERLRPQIDRAGLDLAYALPDSLPKVTVDARRVEQVVLNLVHNAIKFTPSGGQITIAAEQRGSWLSVEVRDTGSGIPADELDRLFERFYKSDKARRSDGTGLGLAIAKHIVQAHGGEVTVQSVVGEGATFRFTLPVAYAAR